MAQPINPPINPVPGAIYVERVTGVSWIWTGVAWVTSGGSDGYNSQVKYGMAITPGFYAGLSATDGGGASNLSSIATQYGPTPPVNPSFGQTWVDTTNPDSPVTSVWTAPGQWTKTSDGVTNTSVQLTAPTDPEVGDTWYQTSTDTFFLWDGLVWRPLSGAGGGGAATGIIAYSTAPVAGAEGSTYYNTVTDKFYVSDGSTWHEVLVAPDKDTHGILALTAPTTRVDGTALQSGDMWVDTGLNQLSYYDAGTSAWTRLASSTSGDTHSFYQSTPPTVRPNNDPLLAGDVWVNSTNSQAYIWTATLWTPISYADEANTNSILSPVAPTTRPGGDTLRQGDLWVNSVSHDVKFWSGSAWTDIVSDSSDTMSIVTGGAPIQRPSGDPLQAGDQWVNPTTSSLFYYNGANWFPISQSADTNSIYQAVQPTSRTNGDPLQTGDLWVNSGSAALSVYSGTAWQLLSSGGTDTHSIAAASAPTVRTNGTALQTGDMWVDTDDNKVYYRTAGGVWTATAAGSTNTNSIVASASPTIRPDTTVLQTGDLWVDSDDSKLYYRSSASSWIPIASTSGSTGLTIVDGTATTTHTPTSGQFLVVSSTTSTNTVTLPAAQPAGTIIVVADGTNNASANNITVNSSAGELFQAVAGPFIINARSGVVRFTYSGISAVGWIYEVA